MREPTEPRPYSPLNMEISPEALENFRRLSNATSSQELEVIISKRTWIGRLLPRSLLKWLPYRFVARDVKKKAKITSVKIDDLNNITVGMAEELTMINVSLHPNHDEQDSDSSS